MHIHKKLIAVANRLFVLDHVKDMPDDDVADLKRYLEARRAGIPVTDQLSQNANLSLLKRIGKVFKVQHDDGSQSFAIKVSVLSMLKLGINLVAIYSNAEAIDRLASLNGFVADFNFKQAEALITAITQKIPELDGKLRLYSTEESSKVAEALRVTNTGHNMWWFWTNLAEFRPTIIDVSRGESITVTEDYTGDDGRIVLAFPW